jgi:DNA-binding CsgD family transcriptional regulator
MSAVEHLKTLCCLGLPPESAMVAVVPVLHEIIPHGWMRLCLIAPDATMTEAYAEHPGTESLFRERMWRFMDDPSAPASLWVPSFRAKGIGWTLPFQGRDWLDSGWYREMEAPLDSCWIMDAMIGDAGRTFALAHLMLTRPRGARPFTADDVQQLDRVRPWIAHALRPQSSERGPADVDSSGIIGRAVRSGQMILMPNANLVFQTPGVESLLRILAGEPSNYTRHVPVRDRLPAPVLKLLRQIAGAANGTSNTPPRMRISTAYGVLTLEAKWLVPKGTLPPDAARDPKSCLIAVTIELHEHTIAYAARVLRENGATPVQTKVGIHLALGMTRPEIADEIGIQRSSVADHAKKLYQTLDVHNSAELATKIWLGQRQDEARQGLRCAGCVSPAPSPRTRFGRDKPPYRFDAVASKRPDEQAAAAMERRGAATPPPKCPVAMARLDLASG